LDISFQVENVVHSGDSYFPILDLLRRYCHLEDTDDARSIHAKVKEHILDLDDALQDTLPALLSLLEVLPADNLFRIAYSQLYRPMA
jgi:hypothetical protein